MAQPNAKFGAGEKLNESRLFDLKNDPDEKINVIDKNPDVHKKMLSLARRVWPDAVG